MQRELKVELGFVQRRLPWLIAAGALVVYLLTLNHSPTFAGMSSLAKAAGWDWRSNVVAPLHVLITFPIRWLPVGLQLFGLNLLAALSAALALGLLARAVSLLPHDRTREQRALERSDHSLLSIPWAWLPPTLAALVCGFQLTFWENAVVATGEAFDLLIFAWLVNCLLDYRLDEKESRLRWFALIYGLAITNNYAMVAFFPAFAMALFWIKGMAFFRIRFLLTLGLLGLAGLCLYLLLPLVESMTDLAGFTFWELLRSYWGYQKSMVLGLPRYIILLCSLTSLVPVLFMGIRWEAQFGEASAVGNALTNLMTHVIHGVFLVACLYVAFDPPFSPRSLTSAFTVAMLPIYFLGALAIGYCSGYFLLVFGAKPGPQAWQRPSPLRRTINLGVVYLVRLAVVAIPVGLLIQNFPILWAGSGQAMSRLCGLVSQTLPPQGAYVLSDDAFRLNSLHYELLKSQPGHKHVLIDTTQLIAAGYHSYLQKTYKNQWPEFQRPEDPKALLDSITLITLVEQLTRMGQVYYLNPSFGYYFEAFYARPSGPVYELKRYEDHMRVGPPPLTPEEIAREDQFWGQLKSSELDRLTKQALPFRKPGKRKIQPKTVQTYLAEIYSRALTEVGVQIQRAGDFVRAARYFDWATQVNPANASALLNLEYNRQHQEKKHQEYKLSDAARQRLEVYGGRWDWILSRNGPVDEPAACLYLAASFEAGRNFRQAAQNLERTLFFDPDHREIRLRLMMMCVKATLPQLALQYMHEFRKRYPDSTLSEAELLDLATIEAWARVTSGDLPGAEQLLIAAQQRYPKATPPWDTLSDIYLSLQDTTNAIKVLERQLQAQPDSVRALANYGGMLLRVARVAEALPHLDKALRLDPKDEPSLINRAQVHLRLEHVDEALRDLQALDSAGTSTYKLHVLFQIAEIYFRKGNKKQAIDYYQRFLKAAPEGLAESGLARARLKQLKSGSF